MLRNELSLKSIVLVGNIVILGCSAFLDLATQSLAHAGNLSAWVTHGTQKVRPTDPPGNTQIAIAAARNEYEPFQIIVRTTGRDLHNVDVALSDLTDGLGHSISARTATIYKEDYINIFHRSSIYGGTGEWPDRLIPKIDPFYQETRNTFPMTVSLVSRPYMKYRVTSTREVTTEGLGDGSVVISGSYTGHESKTFLVEIVSAGGPGSATFKWSNDGGATFTSDLQTASAAIPLSDGLMVKFEGATFNTGNSWTVYASPSRNQPVWIDLYVPGHTTPGVYRGEVTVTAEGELSLKIPVTLEVYNLRIPVTSSLPNYFAMSWYDLGRGHYGTAQNGMITQALGSLYLKSGLRHRLSYSIHSSPYVPLFTYKSDGTIATANYANFDAFVGPYMEGTGTPHGAQLTSIALIKDLHGAGTDPTKRLNATLNLIQHIKARGWGHRLFDYSWDEPNSGDYALVRARTDLIKKAGPDVPRLVTTHIVSELIGHVTRWTPNMVNILAHPTQQARGATYPDPSIYASRKALGEQVWWYQACNNVGCFKEGDQYTQGWPNYAIEYSAITNRIFPWMTYKYRMQGELYFAITHAYGRYASMKGNKVDVADSLLYFGGNGDGTLYYPGRPAEIGGTTHIPLESIRLKLIREGYEDYEYILAARRASGSDAEIDNKISGIVTNTHNWQDNPALLFRLRHELAIMAANETSIPLSPPQSLGVQ